MFVRTDEGIYELTDNMTIETGTYIFFGKVYNTTKKHLFRNDNDLGEFIAQSENLDELCDGFYWDCEDGFNSHNFMNFKIAKDTWSEYVNDCLEDNETPEANMYGFIKTSKGLIYVAKMNSDPILKLF